VSGYGADLRLKRVQEPLSADEDVQFYWRGEEIPLSINFKELIMPAWALQVLDRKSPLGPGVISGELDSSTAISMLNKQGGRTPRLSIVAENFWRWCLKRGLYHVCRHIPGVLNTVADAISARE